MFIRFPIVASPFWSFAENPPEPTSCPNYRPAKLKVQKLVVVDAAADADMGIGSVGMTIVGFCSDSMFGTCR